MFLQSMYPTFHGSVFHRLFSPFVLSKTPFFLHRPNISVKKEERNSSNTGTSASCAALVIKKQRLIPFSNWGSHGLYRSWQHVCIHWPCVLINAWISSSIKTRIGYEKSYVREWLVSCEMADVVTALLFVKTVTPALRYWKQLRKYKWFFMTILSDIWSCMHIYSFDWA